VVPVEEDLEVPVVHPVAARVWYVQKRMRIRQPVTRAGRLLGELP
jgi:maleate cis-trans isomerase